VAVSIYQFQLFFLALTRILAILIQVPVLGGRLIPNQVKIGLGFLLALIISPWQATASDRAVLATAAQPESMPLVSFSVSIGRELLIGTLAGFAATLTFGAIEITATLTGITSGFAAAQTLNPALEHSGSPLDQIYMMAALLLFLVMNGHHLFLLGLQGTFHVLPLNQALPSLSAGGLIGLVSLLFASGIQMAMPVAGTMVLADLALGLLAKVAPQVQVFFLGVPLKIGLSFILVAFSLTVLFPALVNLFLKLAPRMLILIGK
jgi:flagellar biosynthesis protein FliR